MSAEAKVGKTTVRRRVDPGTEYTSTGSFFTDDAAQILTRYNDAIARPIRLDDYDSMMLYPAIESGIEYLRESLTADGYTLAAAVTDKNDKNFKRATKIKEFCERSLLALDEPLLESIAQLLDAMVEGHKLAEVTFQKVMSGPDRGYLHHKSIAVKPRGVLNFVVSRARSILGYVQQGQVVSAETLLPPEKILRLTIKPHNRDPRGTSLLRAAYNSWVIAREFLPLMLDWGVRWAEPWLIGFTATDKNEFEILEDDNGDQLVDEDNVPLKAKPSRAMANELGRADGKRAFGFPKGAKVQVVHSQGQASLWEKLFRMLDAWIKQVILLTALSTIEGQHFARAANMTGQDVTDVRGASLKRHVEAVVYQLLRVLVTLNFGKDAAAKFTPTFSLGTERRNWAGDVEAAVKLLPFASEGQRRRIFAELGYPDDEAPAEKPKPDEKPEEKAAADDDAEEKDQNEERKDAA